MQERVIAGIDIGTTKICVLVGEQRHDGKLTITGIGTGPSQGLRKGVVVNIDETVHAIVESLERAERLSGKSITSAYIGISGNHISSDNSKGFVAISPSHRDILEQDITRAIEVARAIPIPVNREILHVIPRGYVVDGQEGIKNPIGMSGFRLEVEAHIVTGSSSSTHNLVKCVNKAGIQVEELVLSSLASSEAVFVDGETDLGAALVDIGGGVTNIAVFVDGAIWHSAVLPIGGNHITNDIAIGLRLSSGIAEDLKLTYGQCNASAIQHDAMIELSQFITESNDLVSRKSLAEIIQARTEEIFTMIRNELESSGYMGLLPAGIVCTGGTADMMGIAELGQDILDMPVRIGTPQGLHGLADSINRPSYATAVGLLLWGMRNTTRNTDAPIKEQAELVAPSFFGKWLRAFIP